MFSVAGENETLASEFILLGFAARADPQAMFFVLFLAISVVTLLGNLGVIVLIRIDPLLHTPMYFFLSHSSLLDICHSSPIMPWSLRDFLAEKKAISLARCVTQLFSFSTWATAECYVLAATAYGRYVATCRPLLYSTLTSQRICAGMLAGAYPAGAIGPTLPAVSISHAPFCRCRASRHFFCGGPPLLAPSRSDSRAGELVVAVVAGLNAPSTVASIPVSRSSVLAAVPRIRSASLERDKVVSLLDSGAVPTLNPFVYSLRNGGLRNAVRKAKSRILTAWPVRGSRVAERRGQPRCGEGCQISDPQEEGSDIRPSGFQGRSPDSASKALVP